MKTPPVSSTPEGVADRLAEVPGPDRAGLPVHGADHPGRGHEPDPAVPVGERGEDGGAVGLRGHVVLVPQGEHRGVGGAGVGDDVDLAVGGRHDHAVAVVEVEVAAAAEAGEGLGRRRARRQGELGQHVEGLGVEHPQVDGLDAHADREQPAPPVEGDRRALLGEERRDDLGGVAERAGRGAGVGLVGVVVEVAAPVGGHERVPRREAGVRDRPGLAGLAEERDDAVATGVLGDGDRGSRRGERGRQQGQGRDDGGRHPRAVSRSSHLRPIDW